MSSLIPGFNFSPQGGTEMRKWAAVQGSTERRRKSGWLVAGLALLLFPAGARAQNWVWSTETVDKSGMFTSLAIDRQGNLHISYNGGGVKYGFRPAGSSQWFTMPIGQGNEAYTRLALDDQGNPSICFTTYGYLNYARYLNGQWYSQKVATGFGPISFSCSRPSTRASAIS